MKRSCYVVLMMLTCIVLAGCSGVAFQLTVPCGPWVEFSSPEWSPDGKTIALIGKSAGYKTAIYLLDTTNRSLTEISKVHEHGRGIAWSPDGTKIAIDTWHPQRVLDITIMDKDGTNSNRLVHLTNRFGDDGSPSWSPTGESLLLISTYPSADGWGGIRKFYLIDIDDGELIGLTNNNTDAPSFVDADPVWSPDGMKIAFSSWRDDQSNWEIYMMNGDGTGVVRITDHPADQRFPDWSPDGSQLVFTSYDGSGSDIYAVNIDGTGLTQLTHDPAADEAPDWSPDGKQIAFASWRTGSREIFVMDDDGKHVRRLTRNPWSRRCVNWPW